MLALTLLLACGKGEEDRRFGEGEAGSCGSWRSVGQPILLGACTACHASGLSDEARHGAPAGLDLDSLEGARSWAEAIAASVEEGSMPPGGGLSASDAARLLSWLDCGAPGEESTLPAGEAPVGLLGAAETRVSAALDEETGELVLYTDLSGGDLEGRAGPWSEERYEVDGERARLVSRLRYEADGEVALEERWEPPLPLLDGEETAWSVESVVARRWPEGEESVAQSWEASLEEAPGDEDPRLTDPDATLLTLSLASGEGEGPGARALSWRLSADLSLVAETVVAADAAGALASESRTQLTVAWAFEDLPAFPLSAEVEWMGRLLLVEGAP